MNYHLTIYHLAQVFHALNSIIRDFPSKLLKSGIYLFPEFGLNGRIHSKLIQTEAECGGWRLETGQEKYECLRCKSAVSKDCNAREASDTFLWGNNQTGLPPHDMINVHPITPGYSSKIHFTAPPPIMLLRCLFSSVVCVHLFMMHAKCLINHNFLHYVCVMTMNAKYKFPRISHVFTIL